jgi:type I restriction enzyme, S subunit
MIEGLQPYAGSAVKPMVRTNSINIPWLDSMPSHWRMVRSKGLFAPRTERARPDDEQLSATQAYGVIPQAEFERRVGRKVVRITQHLDKRAHVEPDDFVISMRSFQGGLERAWARGCIRSSYVVLRPLAEAGVGYFTHLFKCQDYVLALQATSNFIRDGQDLNMNNFVLIDLPLPPADEQAAIARFLDHANRKIDGFIRAKRKLIALLGEQKQAIIHRTVTRGLNPTTPIKPSGIAWLGDIPTHWEVRRVKQVTKILRGKFSHRPRNDPSLYDGPYPFIQTGSVARAKKFITEYKQTLNERGLAVSKMFPKGTLCMTIAANIGDVAIL